jgi:hypothetical protein
MVTIVIATKKYLLAGGVVMGLVGFGGFAGVAAAEPEACYGSVPAIGAHMPAYPVHRVPGLQDAGCVYLGDTSDTIMTDIDEIGTWGSVDIRHARSYLGNSPAYTALPQSVT